MKRLKNFIVFIASLVILTSCSNDDETINEQKNQQLYPKIAKKLEALHFNPNGLELIDFESLDGTTKKMFLVEGDIVLSEEHIKEMKVSTGVGSKQYRTNNLANDGTYRIFGYTGNFNNGNHALSNREQDALRWAVDNYNRLNLDIRLTLSFGTNYKPNHIVVYRSIIGNGFVGGASSFPRNGIPHKWIRIQDIGGFSRNLIEHIMTHEIGHAFGMRHTDWWSRESCPGVPDNEGPGPEGVIHIPGTPTGFDPTSLMLACTQPNTDGEFNANDRIALRFLY